MEVENTFSESVSLISESLSHILDIAQKKTSQKLEGFTNLCSDTI